MAKRKPSRGSRSTPAAWTLSEVVELVTRNNLAEIEVASGDTRIRVVRERAMPAPAAVPGAMAAPALAERALTTDEVSGNLVSIEAPMVGTFYRSPAPDAAPFVAEGDSVKEGQILCIIEAMKLMNEIEAKAAGRIAKILVENGQPVEYGQALFLVEPRR